MKKICLLLFLCSLLSACGTAVTDPFTGDFSCTAAFERGGTAYTLRYERSGTAESIEVLLPETLAGLCATRKDGAVTLSHADMTFTALRADGLFDFAALFAPCEAWQPKEETFCSADGRTLYLQADGVPTRVCNAVFDIRISQFERREER